MGAGFKPTPTKVGMRTTATTEEPWPSENNVRGECSVDWCAEACVARVEAMKEGSEMRTKLVPGLAILVLLGIFLSACAPAAPAPAAAPTPISTAAAKAAAPAPTVAAKPSPTPAPPTPTPKPEKVVMGVPAKGTTSDLATEVALQKGFWRELGLEVDSQVLGSDVTTKAVIAGEFAYSRSLGSAIRAAASGLPIKGILSSETRPAYYLVVRPEINTLADLKGKPVGVNAIQGTTHILLKDVLKYYGLDPENYLVPIAVTASATRLQSVKGGAMPAAMMDVVFAVRAEKEGLKILTNVGDITERLMGGVATSDKRIKEKSDEVLRFTQGYLKGVKYVVDPRNKTDTIQIMSKLMELTLEDAARVYELGGIKDWLADGNLPEKLVTLEIDEAKDASGISKDVPISQVFDYSFVRKLKQ